MEELESWKCSLIRATNLSGWDSKNYQDDSKLIKSIVEDILKKLIRISPSEPDGLVGMDSHINEIDLLLQVGVDDFRIVGGAPSSINHLRGLRTLSLSNCIELKSLPSSIHMKSLLVLHLSGCSNLKEFPEISGDMNKLYELSLDETAITELPSSIEFLQELVMLTMRNCRSLVCLPDIIGKLACLEELYLNGCSKLSNLPENLGDLKHLSYLRVKGSGIQQLPFSILRLSKLKDRSLSCEQCK